MTLAVQARADRPRWPSPGVLRHQLGTVMGQPGQQVGPAPVEEVVQRDPRVPAYLNPVVLGPSLQAHKRHAYVQGPEQLEENWGSGRAFPGSGGCEGAPGPALTVSSRRATSSVRFVRRCKSAYLCTCGFRAVTVTGGGAGGGQGRRPRAAQQAHLRMISHNHQLDDLGLCHHVSPPLWKRSTNHSPGPLPAATAACPTRTLASLWGQTEQPEAPRLQRSPCPARLRGQDVPEVDQGAAYEAPSGTCFSGSKFSASPHILTNTNTSQHHRILSTCQAQF